MTDDSFGRHVTRLGALADPIRRALYRFVAEQPGAVSRSQAAEGVDVPAHTAKFHLDRLVDEGLLVTEFRRLTGRSGPGAGRPAKLYRRSRREVTVSLPHRRYDLAGHVLADAVERALAGTAMGRALHEAAFDAGSRAVAEAGTGDDEGSQLHRVAGVLAPFGYEPRVDDRLTLRNCPFDRLASDHPDLVCAMNHTFVGAVADALGCSGVEVSLERSPSRCCIRVGEATPADTRS